MTAEHAALHLLFQSVLEAFRVDARSEAGRLWNLFDRRLQAHMAMEERHLLPVLEQVNAAEAAALRRDQSTALRSAAARLSPDPPHRRAR